LERKGRTHVAEALSGKEKAEKEIFWAAWPPRTPGVGGGKPHPPKPRHGFQKLSQAMPRKAKKKSSPIGAIDDHKNKEKNTNKERGQMRVAISARGAQTPKGGGGGEKNKKVQRKRGAAALVSRASSLSDRRSAPSTWKGGGRVDDRGIGLKKGGTHGGGGRVGEWGVVNYCPP